MSIMAPPQPNHSRDLALAAIKLAHREIGLTSEEPMRLDEMAFRPERETKAARLLAEEPTPTPPPPAGDASLGKPLLWSFMGVLALVGAGAAGFVWQKAAERRPLDPISTATVSTAKRELPPPAPSGAAARAEAALSKASPEAETTPQRAAAVASATPAITSDQAQLVQMMARELASARESIDQLKEVQVQLARDNAALTEHLKSAQETARLTSDLAQDLKLTRAQMARDNADFAERLKVNQEQMARFTEQLKAGQEQARSAATEQKPQQSEPKPRQVEQRPQQTEQKPRQAEPKPRQSAVALAPPRPASPVRKPPPRAVGSPQAGVQTPHPPRVPPKPQPQPQAQPQ
jgi:DNA repair exonuclease SbcCD ATPase subunit